MKISDSLSVDFQGEAFGPIRKVSVSLDEWASLCDRLDDLGLGALIQRPYHVVIGNSLFVVEDVTDER